MKQFIKHSLNDAMYVVAVLVLAGMTLLGAPVMQKPSTPFGHFRLTTVPTGVSLYQLGGNHRSYHIAAAQDYTVTSDGKKTPLATWKQTSSLNPLETFVRALVTQLTSMITASALATETQTKTATMVYTPTIVDNTLTVNRTIDFRGHTPSSVTMSLSYSRDDIVLDKTGVVYTENPEESLATLAALIGKPVTRHNNDERRAAAASDTVIIINPAIPGVLVLQARQQQQLVINKDARLVYIEEHPYPDAPSMTSSLDVFTYTTFDQLRRAL